MMRVTRVVMTALLAFAVFTATDALASGGEHGHDTKGKGMMMENMKDHHGMMGEMMGMFRNTMGIVRDLDRAPTAAQKKKLSEMMERMDGMMKKHDEMMKKMSDGMMSDGMMHDGMMKNPCGMMNH